MTMTIPSHLSSRSAVKVHRTTTISTRIMSIHKYVPYVIFRTWKGGRPYCDVNYVAKMGGVTSPPLM